MPILHFLRVAVLAHLPFSGALPTPPNSTLNALHSLRSSLAIVYSTCSKPNDVALTFDDGPYKFMSDILTLLTDNDAKATFFFNGNNYDCIYTEDNVKRVQYAVQQGHQIASHTWSHPRLTQLNTDQIREEFSQIDDAFLKITGLIPAFMRPPYGEYSDDVRMVAAERGQSLAIWDNDTGDSSGLSLDQQKAVYDEFISRKADQGIFLQHEVHDTTVHDLVPYAIPKLKRAGYHMVTLAECLGQDAYQGAAVRLAERDDSWNCS